MQGVAKPELIDDEAQAKAYTSADIDDTHRGIMAGFSVNFHDVECDFITDLVFSKSEPIVATMKDYLDGNEQAFSQELFSKDKEQWKAFLIENHAICVRQFGVIGIKASAASRKFYVPY